MDGRVKEVLVKEGDKVRKDQLLIKFETTVTHLDIQKTQKELAYLEEFKHFIKSSNKDRINLAMVNMARLKS